MIDAIFSGHGRLSRIHTRTKAITAKPVHSVRLDRLSLDLIPNGIHVLSPDGIIQMVNQKWLTMLKYSEAEVIGHHFSEFIIPEEREDANARFSSKTQGAKMGKKGRTYEAKTGERVKVTSEDRYLTDDFGNITGIFTVLTDITEIIAGEAAERYRVLNLLAAGAGHNFNNILSGLTSALFIIETFIGKIKCTGNIDEKHIKVIEEMLGIIKQGLYKGTSISFRIDIASRNEAERSDIAVDVLSDLIPALDFMQLLMGNEKNIILKRTNMHDCKALVRRNELFHVMLETLHNAYEAIMQNRKANEESLEGEIEISMEDVLLEHSDLYKIRANGDKKLIPGNYVKISIRDNGIGITKDQDDKMFTPFYSSKDPAKYPGIGLWTAFSIISQNGGGMNYESTPGQGTTFNIFLPIVGKNVEKN